MILFSPPSRVLHKQVEKCSVSVKSTFDASSILYQMSGRDSSSKAKVKQRLRLRSAPFDLQGKVDDFAPLSRMVLTVIVVDYRVYSSNIFICGEIKNISEYRSFG